MQQYNDYGKGKKKYLGAFYTPKFLADYLAKVTFSLYKLEKYKDQYSVLDPATGDSALLFAFSENVKKKKYKSLLFGIDIEKEAIERSKKYCAEKGLDAVLYQMDALFPLINKTSKEGWKILLDNALPNGIDFIVSNPPWGTSKEQYENLKSEFISATGQFDIYDLFIELSIKILNNNGCFGFIVPDSIYCEEHTPIRKFLLENTTIKRIVRLGEGIFPDINIAVSLIFGIKKKSQNTKVLCSHLSNELKINVLRSNITIEDAVDRCVTKISQRYMIDNDYEFLTDVKTIDNDLISLLNHTDKVGDVVQINRGVELSKKGIVLKCGVCGKYFPKPRDNKKETIRCPHCNSLSPINKLEEKKIVTESASRNTKRLIVGEDIFRYNTRSKSYIETGIQGMNYKDESIYTDSKILVRKTGVGITVGMDYYNCMTNQVVYILRRKKSVISSITNEVVLAVLNSRIITYYIIKTLGSNGWKSNAYLTQKNVLQLPFPLINGDAKTMEILSRITLLVKDNIKINAPLFPIQIDAEIEYLVSSLFGLSEMDYDVIFKAINEVQQMIPFRRLLTITKEDIFRNGI